MIDLHVHILPGLDDGAENMEDALEMAEMALESGVRTIVATPHSNQRNRYENYDSQSLRQAAEKFRLKLQENHLPLNLLPGMEIFASGDMQDKIEKKLLTGINDTDCFLVEFPFDEEPERIGEQLEILRDMGKIPLIAHPERYFCTQEFPALIYGWLQMGCLTQVNKGSILGRFGRRVQQTAEILLGNDLATCIASDAHSPYRRTTYMRDIQVVLEEYWGEETAYRLLVKNPEKIIGRGKIPVHGRPPERKRWFFRK